MGKPNIRPLAVQLPPLFTDEEVQFNQWLAGFIDGDGCFRVTKTYCRFQIEQATWNLHLLHLLKKLFSGKLDKCKRYRNTHCYAFSDREALMELTHMINGDVRATSRSSQVQNVCKLFNINYVPPREISLNNAYLCGLLDADGSVSCNFALHSVVIKASSKYVEDITFFSKILNGNIHRSKGVFVWSISAKEDVLFAQKYFEKNCKSNKLSRIKLIHHFYELRDRKAYKEDSKHHNKWLSFIEKWYSNGADLYRKGCTGRPFREEERKAQENRRPEEIEDGGPEKVEATTAKKNRK